MGLISAIGSGFGGSNQGQGTGQANGSNTTSGNSNAGGADNSAPASETGTAPANETQGTGNSTQTGSAGSTPAPSGTAQTSPAAPAKPVAASEPTTRESAYIARGEPANSGTNLARLQAQAANDRLRATMMLSQLAEKGESEGKPALIKAAAPAEDYRTGARMGDAA
ncbi:MAG: hypothetical protein VXW58_16050 [Pseudomonadota bacterium]|nr:hypothetical protein [Pseudomonadota bacterium]